VKCARSPRDDVVGRADVPEAAIDSRDDHIGLFDDLRVIVAATRQTLRRNGSNEDAVDDLGGPFAEGDQLCERQPPATRRFENARLAVGHAHIPALAGHDLAQVQHAPVQRARLGSEYSQDVG
jgi:hypothetical protein